MTAGFALCGALRSVGADLELCMKSLRILQSTNKILRHFRRAPINALYTKRRRGVQITERFGHIPDSSLDGSHRNRASCSHACPGSAEGSSLRPVAASKFTWFCYQPLCSHYAHVVCSDKKAASGGAVHDVDENEATVVFLSF